MYIKFWRFEGPDVASYIEKLKEGEKETLAHSASDCDTLDTPGQGPHDYKDGFKFQFHEFRWS